MSPPGGDVRYGGDLSLLQRGGEPHLRPGPEAWTTSVNLMHLMHLMFSSLKGLIFRDAVVGRGDVIGVERLLRGSEVISREGVR